MISLCNYFEKKTSYYVSYNLRPKKLKPFTAIQSCSSPDNLCVIIIQGPLVIDNDFTIDTASFYLEYLNIPVVISTWQDEDSEMLKSLQMLGCHIVLSDKPTFAGVRNINYQLVTTKAGIDKAISIGARYICKTRSDQRIGKVSAIDYLRNLVEQFPINDPCGVQFGRIVTLDGDMFCSYWISDFMYFGLSHDLKQLFDIPLDNRDFDTIPVSRKILSEKILTPEIYILKKYIDLFNLSFDFSIKAYWQFVKQYLVCIDKNDLCLYWCKYSDRFIEHHRDWSFYEEDDSDLLFTDHFTFQNWFNLYSGSLIYTEYFESISTRQYIKNA
jgi:hypothetical protein